MSDHTCQFRVYYEDTDAGGVVYYANYLKYAERARTEYLRDAGINQSVLTKNEGILFVVKNVAMELLKPARLDDLLKIRTKTIKISGASIKMQQKIYCEDIKITNINVQIVCVGTNMKPKKIPSEIRGEL